MSPAILPTCRDDLLTTFAARSARRPPRPHHRGAIGGALASGGFLPTSKPDDDPAGAVGDRVGCGLRSRHNGEPMHPSVNRSRHIGVLPLRTPEPGRAPAPEGEPSTRRFKVRPATHQPEGRSGEGERPSASPASIASRSGSRGSCTSRSTCTSGSWTCVGGLAHLIRPMDGPIGRLAQARRRGDPDSNDHPPREELKPL